MYAAAENSRVLGPAGHTPTAIYLSAAVNAQASATSCSTYEIFCFYARLSTLSSSLRLTSSIIGYSLA